MATAYPHTLAAAAFGALALLFTHSATAAEPQECGEQRTDAGGMSESFYRAVEKATQQIADGQYAPAIAQLKNLTESRGSDYELAIAYYNLGFAYNSVDNVPAAVKAFQSALSYNVLPQQQQEMLMFNTGQLLILSKRYDEGIKLLESYMAEACNPISSEAHIFLASAYSETKQFRKALTQVDLAISKAKSPKESWLQLKLAVHYELKDYPGCARTLVQLIGIAPAKPDYWKQLSSIFFEMKNDMESLAVLALAERQGFITKPNEVRNLYNVYMLLELPFKAGLLMEDAIAKGRVPRNEENLSKLADAWINARELPRAEKVLTALANMSEDGEYYFKLGAMYGDDDRWKESRDMLRQALNKGGLKKPGDAWMRLAVAQYNLQDLEGAQASLKQAANYKDMRQQATQWLQHIRSELGVAG